MSADERSQGPPKKVPRVGTPLPTTGDTTTGTPALTKNQAATSDRSGDWRCERYGRPASVFQDAFRRGALDALRLLGRRCCIDCAAEVEELADYYRGADQRRAS